MDLSRQKQDEMTQAGFGLDGLQDHLPSRGIGQQESSDKVGEAAWVLDALQFPNAIFDPCLRLGLTT